MAAAARPKPGEIEERTAPEIAVDGKKIRGSIPYNVASRDLGGWTEIIEPTALRAARIEDLVATVDHQGVPIGRYPTTLAIEDHADGLHWSVTPPENRSDVREAIERRDLKAGSWRMRVGRDEWRGDVRHVHEITELLDVSVVSHPSYPSAAVELRSHNNEATSLENEMDQDQHEHHAVETPEDESRARPAGSLRVEERAETPVFQTLAQVFEERGFPGSAASVTWDEFRTLTWSGGTVLTDLNPIRRAGVSLGYDQRWAYPAFPSTGVDSATTSVQVLRQASRTLPAGTAIVRPIDSVTTKPEVTTVTELTSQQLNQVAAVVSSVPNIHGEQVAFQSMIETDLRLSISEGYDRLVLNGLGTAGTLTAGTADILTSVRRGISQLATAGYAADTLVIDAAGAETLDLLQSSGPEAFWTFGAGNFAPGQIFGLNRRVTKAAGTAVVDSQAFGRLYASPLQLQRFEVDAGLTNRSNFRLEGHATFGVERLAAAARIT
jgi:Escherichia/Staphylococcus phage prohead protease